MKNTICYLVKQDDQYLAGIKLDDYGGVDDEWEYERGNAFEFADRESAEIAAETLTPVASRLGFSAPRIVKLVGRN